MVQTGGAVMPEYDIVLEHQFKRGITRWIYECGATYRLAECVGGLDSRGCPRKEYLGALASVLEHLADRHDLN
jgi:hypothetical protein